MFKSCLPNSALQGNPGDPVPAIADNALRGQDSSAEAHTVANAKGIYLDLLNYFGGMTNTFFVVVTAPPLSDDSWANNARAFNQCAEFVPLLNAAVNAWFSTRSVAPRLSAVCPAGQRPELILSDLSAGTTFTLQRCADLVAGNWTDVATFIGNSPLTNWSESLSREAPCMFYRVKSK